MIITAPEKFDPVTWACSRMILFVTRRRPDLMKKYIVKHANTMALKFLMDWLDAERIAHCILCPSRKELRRVSDGWLCKPHYTPTKFEERMALAPR